MARSNRKRFAGLLLRHARRDRSENRMSLAQPPLSTKFRRKTMPSGTIYECRPDGWRWVGFKV